MVGHAGAAIGTVFEDGGQGGFSFMTGALVQRLTRTAAACRLTVEPLRNTVFQCLELVSSVPARRA